MCIRDRQVVQSLSERPASITRRRLQTLKDSLSLFVATQRADKHAGMAEVGRHFDVRYGYEPDTWILNLALEDLAQFNSQLFFNPIDASALHLSLIHISEPTRLLSI